MTTRKINSTRIIRSKYSLDLLEKNRVIHQGSAERNYHIFYQLLYATSDEELKKLCLLSRNSEDYGFLKEGVPSVDAIDDHEEFEATVVSTRWSDI